ncbi:MAG: hypothetical protein V3U54_13365 [Thermodesulfobacteriota bacterium]
MTDLEALARNISNILLLTGYFQLDDDIKEVKSLMKFLSEHPAQNKPAVFRYLQLRGYFEEVKE